MEPAATSESRRRPAWPGALIALVAFGALAVPSFASPLPISGGTETGTQIDLMTGAFSASVGHQSLIGSYSTEVYRENGGTLDFVYNFTSTGDDEIEQVTMAEFGGTLVNDVLYDHTGPDDIDPSGASIDSSGNTVTIDFSPNYVLTGDSSDTLIVQTAATSYDDFGSFSFQDGIATTVDGFEPAPVTGDSPEPTPLAAGAAFCLMIAVRRVRHRPA